MEDEIKRSRYDDRDTKILACTYVYSTMTAYFRITFS